MNSTNRCEGTFIEYQNPQFGTLKLLKFLIENLERIEFVPSSSVV
jgi:hypothetical protein